MEKTVTVRLAISNIKIEPASEAVHPKMDRSYITVNVHWEKRSALELNLFVGNYESVDAAIEEARKQILQLAEDLKEAASKPLVGSKRPPESPADQP